MPKNLEIERKFLIDFPKSWSQFTELLENVIDIKRISQTYLNKDDDGVSPRVRKSVDGLLGETNVVYTYNKKHFVSNGINEEKEEKISKEEYEKLLKNKSSTNNTLQKIRLVFKYHDQLFEFDLLQNELKGLAILEIELKTKNDSVELPPFLVVLKEVTGDKKYNNFELSKNNNFGR